MHDSLEALAAMEAAESGGLARFEHGSLEVLVLDLELPDPELDELSESEREVAMWVLEGASNAEIAEARGVSVRTVANQLRAIFQKLGVCSRWDLTLLMTRRALQAQAAAPTVLTRAEEERPPASDRSQVYNSSETARILRKAYDHYGADFDRALRTHDVVLREDGALPRADYCALFEGLERGSGRPGLGFELPGLLPLGSMGLVEWLAAAASTLDEGLVALSTFGSLLHPGAERATSRDSERLILSYATPGGAPPRVILDWSFGYALRALEAGTGEPLEPLEVHLPYAAPGDSSAEDFYGCPVRYGADACRLVLPREVGDARTPRGDPEVFELFRTLARLQVGQLRGEPIVHEAWAAIMRCLRAYETPRLKSVARALDTSKRTLQRRLVAVDLTFRGLVSAARLQRALGAIGRGEAIGLDGEGDAIVDRAFRRVATPL